MKTFIVNVGPSQESQERAELTETILNAPRSTFTRAQLDGMSIDMLRKIDALNTGIIVGNHAWDDHDESMLTLPVLPWETSPAADRGGPVANYSGAAGAVTTTADDEATLDLPKLPWDRS